MTTLDLFYIKNDIINYNKVVYIFKLFNKCRDFEIIFQPQINLHPTLKF